MEMKITESLEELEDSRLSDFAMQNSKQQRLYPEPGHSYRTAFQRDRDRVIHSKAFRRLGYKTQVFVNSEGDNYRTRLTHSLEVSQIARSVATVFHLNRDYAETLALSHDLGHTPFGHAGQDTLHKLMKDYGGFEHNSQSLRIVHFLEMRYPDWPGLNLTLATLKGMMKHGKVYECDRALQDLCRQRQQESPPLEALLVDLCDRIAYVHHDLEDGLDSGYLIFEEVMELPFWKQNWEKSEQRFADRFTASRLPLRIRTVIRSLINECITDLIENGQKTLPEGKIVLSSEMKKVITDMYAFLREKLYNHYRVMQMSARGKRIIGLLFHEFCNNPALMPAHVQARIEEYGLQRTVSDYIAGMTDRFAMNQYRYLIG